MVKTFSQTKKQAPSRRQIDIYVAAQNHKFESKIKELRQTVKALQVELGKLLKEKSTFEQEIQPEVEAIERVDNQALNLKTLKAKLVDVERSLSTSNVELRSLETKYKQVVTKIKQVEIKLEALGNKLFKKQQRENCRLLLNDLRNKKEQIDTQKLSQANSNQALRQTKTDFEKKIRLRSYIAWGNSHIKELEAKIRAKEKSLTAKNKALDDLTEKFKEEKSLEESLLIPRVAKFVAKQKQELERKRLVQQSEIEKIEKNIEKLTLYLSENSLSDLEKKLHAANTASEKLENRCNLLQDSITRWIKNKKATNQNFHHEFRYLSPDQVLLRLKRGNRLHVYLPLSNMDAKHAEYKKLLDEKRTLISNIEEDIKKVKRSLTRLTNLKEDLSVLEKIEVKLLNSTKRGALPRMDIENWSDAELFAEKYMKWLGFADAKRTGAGADEGKDIDSRKAIAQVKDMGTGASRPMLQQLNGVAAAERKIPIFFARSYAATAKEWGEKHGIALFQFSLHGDVKAVSKKAKELLVGWKTYE